MAGRQRVAFLSRVDERSKVSPFLFYFSRASSLSAPSAICATSPPGTHILLAFCSRSSSKRHYGRREQLFAFHPTEMSTTQTPSSHSFLLTSLHQTAIKLLCARLFNERVPFKSEGKRVPFVKRNSTFMYPALKCNFYLSFFNSVQQNLF